jgi:hypothetical protein
MIQKLVDRTVLGVFSLLYHVVVSLLKRRRAPFGDAEWSTR